MLVREDEISVTDTAAVLGRHRITIYWWCRKGTIKSRRRGQFYFPLLAAVAAIRAKEQRIARMKDSARRAGR